MTKANFNLFLETVQTLERQRIIFSTRQIRGSHMLLDGHAEEDPYLRRRKVRIIR